MPRNRALLTLRAVNSVNTEFGAKITASVIARNPESLMVCAVTAVTLARPSFRSADSFSGVTTTGGNVTVGGCDCAKEADEARRTTRNAGRLRNIPTLCLHGAAGTGSPAEGGREYPGSTA